MHRAVSTDLKFPIPKDGGSDRLEAIKARIASGYYTKSQFVDNDLSDKLSNILDDLTD
jgi:hypothetical protein